MANIFIYQIILLTVQLKYYMHIIKHLRQVKLENF